MRTLRRNARKIWYAIPLHEDPELNPEIMDGEYSTGERTVEYADPKETWANVSPASGSSSAEPFGSFCNYSATICVSYESQLQLTVGSAVWVERTPPAETNDYVVSAVAKSINGIQYALQEVL